MSQTEPQTEAQAASNVHHLEPPLESQVKAVEETTPRPTPQTTPQPSHRVQSNLERAGYGTSADGIRAFQHAYGLAETGTLTPETTALLSLKRCGMSDAASTLEIKVSARGRKQIDEAFRMLRARGDAQAAGDGQARQGDQARGDGARVKARRGVITFGFGRRTRDINLRKQRRAIRRAFRTWGAVIPFRFRQRRARKATIKVSFVKKRHGDGYPFDGRGGTLAHAFFPCNRRICSDVHFDDGEKWGLRATPQRIDLQTVALHEIGHALGLGHSNVSAAVMFAFYQGERRALNPNDVSRIRAIYGSS